MKKVVALLALASIMGLVAGVALSADAKPITTSGTVVNVDGKTLVLKVAYKSRDGKDTTVEQKIATDDKTTVTLDDKAAKLADLKEGQTAVVTYAVPEGGLKPGASLIAGKVEAKSAAK